MRSVKDKRERNRQDRPVDFVITWVDGADPAWLEMRARYADREEGDIRSCRFRDMDVLRYWFRGVERFAPWVRRVYFVSCGQVPEWINRAHPGLVCVDHRDFIPEEYLPTFSSHAIEWNLHRIPGLSEHFVYFNDDMFLINPTTKEDFFVNGLPCDMAVLNYPAPRFRPLNLVPYINTAVINRNFGKKEVLGRQFFKFYNWKYEKYLLKNLQFSMGKFFPGFKYFHLPSSFLKETFEELWEKEYEILHETCSHRFRNLTDVNQWLAQNWQICSGNFCPRSVRSGYYGSIADVKELERVSERIRHSRYKMICANDEGMEDFGLFKESLREAFQEILPDRSGYER